MTSTALAITTTITHTSKGVNTIYTLEHAFDGQPATHPLPSNPEPEKLYERRLAAPTGGIFINFGTTPGVARNTTPTQEILAGRSFAVFSAPGAASYPGNAAN